MAHIPVLIKDLALILGAAGVTTLLFRRLKQPMVLGYIVAGLLVGPHVHLFPSVVELDSIKIWAEIGVIFLLFALGLEFSFKKLAQVGGSGAITGIIELTGMMILGFVVGGVLGWSLMDRIFLGGIIAISSTTIIFRAFDELSLKSQQFTGLVLGVLIIEDLVAILLMVLLSTVAVSAQFEGIQMVTSMLKLIFFLCAWFVMGIFILPTFLKQVSKLLNSETLLIVSLALCLGMVALADQAGFSAALGAFIMGSLFAETTQAHRIEVLVSSVKNLFGAIFFVSVGMMIDPSVLIEYALPVIVLTLSVVFGKTLFVTIGAILAARPLKQAVKAGTSMAQIGEFSFIIATLGLSLKVISPILYPIAVGVSVITTFATPFMMRLADPLHLFLLKVLPSKWLIALEQYSSSSQLIESESNWKKLLRFYLQIILINSVILVAMTLIIDYFIQPFFLGLIANPFIANLMVALIGFVAMSPFIWALMVKKMNRNAYAALWLDKKYHHGPLVMVEIARTLIAVLLIGFLLSRLFEIRYALVGTFIIMLVVGIFFRKRLQDFYQRMEKRFLQNLHEKEMLEQKKSKSHLSPWDAHLTRFSISPQANFIGSSLEDLQWREQFGVNVAYIERGNQVKFAPPRNEPIFPFDILGVIGTDLQLKQFAKIIVPYHEDKPEDMGLVDLEKILVDENTRLRGLSIRESGIRERTDGLVVGIERAGERILNPPSDLKLEWDDVVWIVGNRKKIQELYSS